MIAAEIIAYERDQNKNIIIWICFSRNGIEYQFYKDSELLIRNGHNVWPLHARYHNFLGKTQAQIFQWIRVNVEHHIGNLIQADNAALLNGQIETSFLSKLIGQTISKSNITIPVDINNDGVPDAIITLNDDGTYTVA